MPEETIEVPAVEEKPAEKVVEQPKPLLRRVIQPKDKDGKPIGSPHVYTGATEQEIADKMAVAIQNQTWKIRELTLASREQAKPPEGAELETRPVPATPKELSADERFQIAEKMKNPETVVEGYRDLHKATTGRTPEEEAEAEKAREKNASIAATRAAAMSFVEAHQGRYYSTPGNGKLMGEYLSSHGMSTTSIKNYEIAFRELSADGLLETEPVEEPEQTAPVIVKEEKKEPVVVEAAPRTEAPATRTKSAIPSSLSRDQASGTGKAKSKEPTAAEIAMMNAAQYKAYLEGRGMWGK